MFTTSGLVDEGGRSGSGYRLVSKEVVQTGRRREFVITIVIAGGLLALQYPLRATAIGDWQSRYPLPPAVPARLSLIIDVFLIVAYVFVAYRSWGLVRSHRTGPLVRRASQGALTMVLVGAAMDIWEDIVLWHQFARADKPGDSVSLGLDFDEALGHWAPLATDRSYYSCVMVGLVTVGLVVGLVMTWIKGDIPPLAATAVPSAAKGDDVVICCSGGGIRAASFSLGGLQVLSEHGIYDRASAVVGVSGGGYVAAATHTVRWRPADEDSETSSEWPRIPPDDRAFSLDSPETQWLRRHTRYVLDSVGVAAQAALSLLFGIAVNLLLIAIALGGLAWLLGWFFLASGRLEPWPAADEIDRLSAQSLMITAENGISGGPVGRWDVGWLIVVALGVGLAAFLVERVWDRFGTPPELMTRLGRPLTVAALVVGVALAALLFLVPLALEEIAEYTAQSGSPLARLFYQLGFVPEDVCMAIVEHDAAPSACGVESATTQPDTTAFTVVSFAGVVSAILGVLASAKSSASDAKDGSSGLRGLLAKVWAKVKDPIVPWAAAAAVVVIALTVLLRWTIRLVSAPELLEEWHYAAIFGGLLIVTKLGTEPNRTSMHHFFRERISLAFLVRRLPNKVEPVPYQRPLRYSQAAPPADRGPRLVTCAVANVTDQNLVPSRRGCTPFVFDHERMGLTDRMLPEGAALRPSAVYEFAADYAYRDATIPAAVAISAAAFSPLAGRESVRLGPYRAVLALGNARLGVWLPNPVWVDEAGLVRRLLRLGRLDEAWDAWQGLPTDEKARLRLSAVKHARIKRGAHWAALRSALNAVERAQDLQATNAPDKAAHRQEALARATSALTDASMSPPNYPALVSARLALEAALKRREHLHRVSWTASEIVRSIFKKPGLSRLLKEAIGRASVYDRFLYITDGGHYDNLGLIEALRRRPRDIYVLDASNDREDTFRTLGRAIATARMDLDCEISIDPSGMRRLKELRSGTAWCKGTYAFADGAPGQRKEGTIFFVKAILTEKVGWDVETYAADNLDFPRTSTNNQLYSEFDFEAYRALGSHAVSTMLESYDYVYEHLAHPRRAGTGS
jgi:hypothetical protein